MYKIFSVDDHVVEHPEVWSTRVPAKFRETAPHVVEEGGEEFWVYDGTRAPTLETYAIAGKPRETWTNKAIRFDEMIPGCYDPKDRARDLLSQGVLASINFPTLPRFGGMLFAGFKDRELADVCVRAWNDFILDEWCPAGPEGMFVPMIITQVWDPELAAAEIRRCAARGARAVSFPENPIHEGFPSFHTDHWDPIWATVQETEMPVCLHIGSGGHIPAPDPRLPGPLMIGLGSVAGLLSMVNLFGTPIFSKFPRIQVVFSEAGIGWIPGILERMDRQMERHYRYAGGFHGMMPSEIFRNNMYACMVEEPIGIQLYELVGVERIFAETDYPHADTPYPTTQKAYDEVFQKVPVQVARQICWENAERAFHWKMADEALLNSPDVKAWRATLEREPYAALNERREAPGVEHRGG